MEPAQWILLLRQAIAGAPAGDPWTALARGIASGEREDVSAIPPPQCARPEHRWLVAYAASIICQPLNDVRASRDRDDCPDSGPAISAAERVWRELISVSNHVADRRAIDAILCAAEEIPATVSPADEQPEAFWFNQLVLLHGLTSLAVHSGDERLFAAAMRLAQHHEANTQPDHATADPWALHAFIFNPGTGFTADGIYNACMVQYGGTPRGAALVLLADAVYCLCHVGNKRRVQSLR